MVSFTVEGRPFWVKPEHIIAVGTGYTMIPPPVGTEGDGQRVVTTMLTVAYVGTLPVEESVEEVLSVVNRKVSTRANKG